MSLHSRLHALVVVLLPVVVSGSCKSDAPGAGELGTPPDPALIDSDGDGTPDGGEDRNRNGRIDPGETDPNSEDTDGDGIADGDEVSYIACNPAHDRPFRVYDAPGAGSMVLTDAAVDAHSILTTPDNYAPGIALADDAAGVAAVLIRKRPSMGVTTPGGQREHELRSSLRALGQVSGQRTRALMTTDGSPA